MIDASGRAARPVSPVRPLPRRAPIGALLFVLLTLAGGAFGCRASPPALEVGQVRFAPEEVRGLSAEQFRTLTRITALGIAVADGTPEVLGRPILERRRREALAERLREEVALERASVSESVLEARYATRPEWELEVRHLVLLSERWRAEAHRAEARRRAEAARVRVLAGEPFEEVAGEVSEEPGARERGGLLEPGREGSWVSEFWEAAVMLEPGGVSPVVESEYGFHVLLLEDRREVPFAEARDGVAADVARQVDDDAAWRAQVEEWLAGLEIHPERMGSTGLPAEDDEQVVARWHGGELTARQVAMEAAGFEGRRIAGLQRDHPETRAALVHDIARMRILTDRAEARGLEVSGPELEAITREWERSVGGWAGVFGFEPGLPAEEIGARAMAGLTGSGQNLGIARGELNRIGAALDRAYPVRFPDRED